MTEAALNWWPEEADAWRVPPPRTTSQWADACRVLPESSAAPGPWRTDVVPFARAPMDAFSHPAIREITMCFSTQVSKTEGMLNMGGKGIEDDPGPMMFVLPNDEDAKELNQDRFQRMLFDSPSLARKLTGNPDDVQTQRVKLLPCTIYFRSARSPAKLASKPIKYLFLDETDKYETTAGREANPIKLARERTRTFWNSKVVKACTPTYEHGYIWIELLKGSHELYYVPCPHCGWHFVPRFEDLRWPQDERDPEMVKGLNLAEMYCPSCGQQITDAEKAWMLANGTWVSRKYQQIDHATGRVTPERLPDTVTHRSFWLWAWYSPWLKFSEIAAEFLSSKDNPTELMNFVNSWLAQPWKDQAESPVAATILERRCELPPYLAPEKCVALTAGIDMQQKGFWYTVWGWRRTLESWLVAYGFLPGWDDVERLLFDTAFERADGGVPLRIWRAFLDTGGTRADEEEGHLSTRTEEAYDFLRANHRGMVWGVKGASTYDPRGPRIKASDAMKTRLVKQGKVRAAGVPLLILDTHQLKDLFWARLLRGHENGQAAHLHAETGEDYARELLGEEKRRDPRTRKMRWLKIGNRKVDLLDATIYAHAAADVQWLGGVRALPEPGTRTETPRQAAPRAAGRREWGW